MVNDIGSGMVKARFAGDNAPNTVFQLIVGRPRHMSLSQYGTKIFLMWGWTNGIVLIHPMKDMHLIMQSLNLIL